MIERVNYVALRAAEPRRAAEFAARLGFSLVHSGDDGTQYLRAHGFDPYSLVYVPGEAPGLDHVSYLVADDEAVAALQEKIQRAGVAVESLDAGMLWDHDGAAIRFRTPSGHQIQVTTGVHIEKPMATIIQAPGISGPAPITVDHVGLAAPAYEQEEAFFVDTMGLLRSNRVMTPDGLEIMGFFRAPDRYLYHCVVIARAPEPALHHYQCSLKNLDAFYQAYEGLKSNGVEVEWGPLRHGPGHNVAMYFRDGAGYWLEYSVEEELILDDEHYIPRIWSVTDERVVDEWQSGPPPPPGIGPPPKPE